MIEHKIIGLHRKLWCLGFLFCMACSGSVGPKESLLIGTWEQVSAAQTDSDLRVDAAIIQYDADGTSTFEGQMTLSGAAPDPVALNVTANVDWLLEETILIRTLTDVSIQANRPSDTNNAVAQALENAYRQTPPARLIIETLDSETLVVLDADTGAIQSYRRVE